MELNIRPTMDSPLELVKVESVYHKDGITFFTRKYKSHGKTYWAVHEWLTGMQTSDGYVRLSNVEMAIKSSIERCQRYNVSTTRAEVLEKVDVANYFESPEVFCAKRKVISTKGKVSFTKSDKIMFSQIYLRLDYHRDFDMGITEKMRQLSLNCEYDGIGLLRVEELKSAPIVDMHGYLY
jgi:hypothetical protein